MRGFNVCWGAVIAAGLALAAAPGAAAQLPVAETSMFEVQRTEAGTYLGQFRADGRVTREVVARQYRPGEVRLSTRFEGQVSAIWAVNWSVVREVRYRHRLYCHRNSANSINPTEPLIKDFPVQTVYASGSASEPRFSVEFPEWITTLHRCSVMRHRLNVTYETATTEHRFSPGWLTPQLVDFGRFE